MVIDLTSPQGTTSRLLARRPEDDATYGLDAWPFMSVEFWGENPQGEWTLKIADDKVKAQYIRFRFNCALPHFGILHDWLKNLTPYPQPIRD